MLAVSVSAAQGLRIGAGSSVITPYLEQPMAGYYYPRAADGVHDDLHAKALVFEAGGEQIVLVACDTVDTSRGAVEEARKLIGKRLGIPAGHILISATHCHTGPVLTPDFEQTLSRRIADAVTTAAGRKTPARLFVTTEQEASLPHYRRYLMKDGTVRTNPGFLNPDIVKPMGEIDPRVGVLFAEGERGEPLLTWVNYAMHLDTVGGTWISSDYPFYLGRLLGRVKGPDMLTVFTIGAAGNINHWDVRRPGPQRGQQTAQRLGEVLGAAVVKAYTHLEAVTDVRLAARSARLRLPCRKVTAEDVASARKIVAVPPDPNVDFTLERVRAVRDLQIEKRRGEDIEAEIQVLAAGPVAFVGIPGELFVELGREIRQKSPFPYTFVVTLANDGLGYIPTREAYDQGAYEPTSTLFAPGSGEMIRDKAVELLRGLHQQ
jgi:hypothetical protein